MEASNIYTISHGVIPVPSAYVIPGLQKVKGNTCAFEHIIKMVCDEYGLTEKAVMSKTRRQEIIKARQIIHSLLRYNFKKLSLSKIGRRCGNKDHSTVINSCKSVMNQVETNKFYREEYEAFDNNIKLNINRFKQTHLKFKTNY
jgi:chromosomal replication initiator protein